ncbi:MAG: hypothetical protein M3O03_00370 [Pseudomonadota bacterium]|nr:hypothetical protein [Pseudomonadota bacterium]
MHKSLARICDQAAAKRLAQSLINEKRRPLFSEIAAEPINRAAPCNAPHNQGGRHEVTTSPIAELSMLGAPSVASSYFSASVQS